MIRTILIALLGLAAVAHAAPPDWTGYYMLARGRDLTGLNVVNPDLNETVKQHLQPWATRKMQATDGVADDTGAVCMPTGILRAPGTPFSGNFLMLPQPDKVIMAFWEANTSRVRRIHLTRDHPRNLRPTWNGDSVGHWEGDGPQATLVIDTIGFNDKSWLSGDMTPHTEETHLRERLKQIEHNSNTYLELIGIVEDRHALTSAYTYTRYYKRQTVEIPEHICADDIAMWKQWRNDELKLLHQRASEVK